MPINKILSAFYPGMILKKCEFHGLHGDTEGLGFLSAVLTQTYPSVPSKLRSHQVAMLGFPAVSLGKI